MSEPRVVITGAQGAVSNRLEINDLIKNTDQFSLYIQALTAMFNTPQSNSLSQFGIGGIHGLPYEQWEGSGNTNPVPGSKWGGYCTHGNVLFPTWHRSYVALYEQVLQQHAIGIAKKYQDQQRWLSAAQNLRAPYWDWATNSVPPPEVISLQTVNIITPDGNTTAVPNPLYQYTFNPTHSSFPAPYKHWKTTIRYPDDPDSPDATTNIQALKRELLSAQSHITESTYRLLTLVRTWPAFSNHTEGDGGSASNSLEAIHDGIHLNIGGHMGDPKVAGFDPIFFLHHCNVDRILSLWAAVNPGVWVSEGSSEEGTFTIPGGSSIDTNTVLTPFWDTQETYWLSSQATATEKLKYSYPEFNGLDLGDPNAVKDAIGNHINRQYGFRVLSLFRGGAPMSLFAQPAAGGAQAPVQGHSGSPTTEAESAVKSASNVVHQFHSQGGNPHTAQKPEHGKEGQNVLYDWTVRIHFKQYELGGSFAVLIFLGRVPDGPSQWRTAPTFVGSHHAFVSSVANRQDNGRDHADTVVEGFVHLNWAIAERSGLSSFEPDVVIPYLKENLHWRVQAADRTAVDISRLPSLEVTVVSTPLTHPPGSIFPIPGDPQYHNEITYGRPGGARRAQA